MIQRLWLRRRHSNRKWQISLLIIPTSSTLPNPRLIEDNPLTTMGEFGSWLPLGTDRHTSSLSKYGRTNERKRIGVGGGTRRLLLDFGEVLHHARPTTARDEEYNFIQAMMSPGSLSCTNNVAALSFSRHNSQSAARVGSYVRRYIHSN